MSFLYSREGDNVVYKITQTVGGDDIHQVFDQYYHDYQDIGDALGIAIDVREMTQFSMMGSRVAYQRIKGVHGANLPMAIVGKPDSFLQTALRMIEVIAKRSMGRITYHDTLEDALAWLDEWYAHREPARDILRGQVTVNLLSPDKARSK